MKVSLIGLKKGLFTYSLLALFAIDGTNHLNAEGATPDTFQIDPSGNMVGVWQELDNIQQMQVIRASTKPVGSSQSFTPSVIISASGVASQEPVLTIGTIGNSITGDAVALWLSVDTTTLNPILLSSNYDFSQAVWSTPPQVISDPLNEQVMNGTHGVTFDNLGNLTAYWMSRMIESGVTVNRMRTATGTFGDSWNPPSSIQPAF